jgi:hypothetical protein
MSDSPWNPCSNLKVPDAARSRRDLRDLDYQLDYASLSQDAHATSSFILVNSETVWTPLPLGELELEPSGMSTMSSQQPSPKDNFDSRSFMPDCSSTVASTSTASMADFLVCHICGVEFTGRFRVGNLARHKRSLHNGPLVFPCLDAGCHNVFKRQDARLKHLRKYHPNLVPEPVLRPARKQTRPREHDSDQSTSHFRHHRRRTPELTTRF